MAFAYVFYLLGFITFTLGASMIFPCLIEWGYDGGDATIFFLSGVGICLVSSIIILAFRRQDALTLNIREAFLLTVLVWVVSICVGSIPLILGSIGLDMTDAVFQSTSMLTTTGANLILDLNHTSKGILFWCSLLQWMGGKGIILLALLILPALRVGGQQLMYTESTEKVEKITPRMNQMALHIFGLYALLTSLCALLLWWLGFDLFDAVCHGFTTLSTGGFSTWDESIARMNTPMIQLTISLFMLMGACPFVAFLGIFKTQGQSFIRDPQVLGLFFSILAFTLLITLWRMNDDPHSLEIIFVASLFNITSAISTTGFVSANYTLWGGLAMVVFFFLPFIGGCTGSTSGGIKIFRIQILWAALKAQVRKSIHPHGVFAIHYNNRIVPDGLILSVACFCALFIFSFVILSIGLSLFDLDFITSVSGVASAITSLGPGLGDIIGPAGNYESLPDGAKWLLSFAMLLGRIEIVSLVLIMLPSFWKS